MNTNHQRESSRSLSAILSELPVGFYTRLERLQGSRLWPILVVVVALCIAYVTSFPFYGGLKDFNSSPYGKALTWWLSHPLANVPIGEFFPKETLHLGFNAGCASHCDKLAFRPVLPLINCVAPFGLCTLVGISHLAGCFVFLITYVLVKKTTGDPVAGALATWTLAGTFAGTWGFHDSSFGDALAVALVLSAMLARSGWFIMFLLIVAGFTDERAITAAPLVALFHLFKSEKSLSNKSDFWRDCWVMWPAIGAVCCYGIIRIILKHFLNLSEGADMLGQWIIIRSHFYNDFPVKIFGVFKFLWMAPMIFILASIKYNHSKLPAIIYSLAMLLAATPALLVWDVDRSLYYLLPGVLIAVCCWSLSNSSLRNFLSLCLAGSLFWLFPKDSISEYVEVWLDKGLHFVIHSAHF